MALPPKYFLSMAPQYDYQAIAQMAQDVTRAELSLASDPENEMLLQNHKECIDRHRVAVDAYAKAIQEGEVYPEYRATVELRIDIPVFAKDASDLTPMILKSELVKFTTQEPEALLKVARVKIVQLNWDDDREDENEPKEESEEESEQHSIIEPTEEAKDE